MGTYGAPEIASLDPQSIFSGYARLVGIGGIAMAGIIGIVKSWPIITQAVGLAGREIRGGGQASNPVRWQLDISMKHLVAYIAIALVAVLLFFWFGVISTFWQALVAWIVVTVIAFLFTTVAANACHRGQQPRERHDADDSDRGFGDIRRYRIERNIGHRGLDGDRWCGVHRPVDGRWLRHRPQDRLLAWFATPKKQESWKFLGTLVSAATVGGVILLLNQVYGFTGPDALVAPQANAMAKVIEPLMMGGDTPWILYIVGAILALLLNWLGVPALAFCLACSFRCSSIPPCSWAVP